MVVSLWRELSFYEGLRFHDDRILQREVYTFNLDRSWWADGSASFDYLLATDRDSSPSVCLHFVRHCLCFGYFASYFQLAKMGGINKEEWGLNMCC